jgi:hypothetical protein
MNKIIVAILCSFVWMHVHGMDEKKKQEENSHGALEISSVQLELETKQSKEKGVIPQASFFIIHATQTCFQRKGIGLAKCAPKNCIGHEHFDMVQTKFPVQINCVTYHDRTKRVLNTQVVNSAYQQEIIELAKARLDPKYKPQACPKKSYLEEDRNRVEKFNFNLCDKDGDFLTSFPISYKTPTATELDDLRPYIDLSLLDFKNLQVKKNNQQRQQ